jgi:hypothetical protein
MQTKPPFKYGCPEAIMLYKLKIPVLKNSIPGFLI